MYGSKNRTFSLSGERMCSSKNHMFSLPLAYPPSMGSDIVPGISMQLISWTFGLLFFVDSACTKIIHVI